MFYRLKHLLLVILVISKLKCNNLIFNEILVLIASYVYLHAFLLHRESSDLDPADEPLIFEVVLSHNGIRDRLGINIHSKHLKITTTFTVRTISPYKDYSSILMWQSNICVYIATTELH
jgi:hypothetical protein